MPVTNAFTDPYARNSRRRRPRRVGARSQPTPSPLPETVPAPISIVPPRYRGDQAGFEGWAGTHRRRYSQRVQNQTDQRWIDPSTVGAGNASAARPPFGGPNAPRPPMDAPGGAPQAGGPLPTLGPRLQQMLADYNASPGNDQDAWMNSGRGGGLPTPAVRRFLRSGLASGLSPRQLRQILSNQSFMHGAHGPGGGGGLLRYIEQNPDLFSSVADFASQAGPKAGWGYNSGQNELFQAIPALREEYMRRAGGTYNFPGQSQPMSIEAYRGITGPDAPLPWTGPDTWPPGGSQGSAPGPSPGGMPPGGTPGGTPAQAPDQTMPPRWSPEWTQNRAWPGGFTGGNQPFAPPPAAPSPPAPGAQTGAYPTATQPGPGSAGVIDRGVGTQAQIASPGGAGQPSPATQQMMASLGLPLDPTFEAQRRLLDDSLAQTLAPISSGREQVGAQQNLALARMGTQSAYDQQAILDQMAGRGTLNSSIYSNALGSLATDELRARQDLASQIADLLGGLSQQSSGAYTDYNQGLMEALLELANRAAGDPYAPVDQYAGGGGGQRQRGRRRNRRGRGRR